MRDFPGHEEPKRIFEARVIGQVDQMFIDDFRARFDCEIGAQVCHGLTDAVDLAAVQGTPAELTRAGPPP